jgi:hypothetical protein
LRLVAFGIALAAAGYSVAKVLYDDVAADLIWLESLAVRDGSIDARDAIAGGNQRFLGLGGQLVRIPGVDEPGVTGCVAFFEAVDIIRGTSHPVSSERHAHLVQAASRYAASYNRVVAAHRGIALPFRCVR